MENPLKTILHGSDKIIKVPTFGKGEINTDYGQGFYCTKNKGLAGEWAVFWSKTNGYINEYTLDDSELTPLLLNSESIETWIAIVTKHRRGNYEEEYQRRINAFISRYDIDISKYDIIEGWRADDAYFSFIEDFFALALSLEKLKEAMKFGDLGNQICLKSEKAFEKIKYVTNYPAQRTRFLQTAEKRNTNAKTQYRHMRDKTAGTLLIDIIGRENL